ncbi:uncharacterized protein K02A2.6-like [Metopolophium dirhodum]|uniref:uncharacterized protein K02A2.6-like n=1 Tax=Metopolophium dirhodum TaxID=44670 RepID=UPI00298FCBF1|nr:uncharacterized protein K02A2.6-like [Metopolophium dirhodum]
MASKRLQRWALFLSEFDYELKYVQGKNNCAADGLSRLPLEVKREENDNEYSYKNFVEGMIPLDLLKIKIETRKDRILSKVYSWIEEGWPEKNKLRIFLLKETHNTHAGIAKIKAITRSYFWWPRLDKEIESYVKSCEVCVSCQSSPVVDRQAKWAEAVGPLEQVHLDFLYLNNKNYLVWIDAFTKWPDVIEMSKMNSVYLIDKLSEIFGRFGLPNTIIPDNGPQFRSSEFIEFCKQNGIVFYTSPPFHPATNGAAENAVKSFKRGIHKPLKDKNNKNVTAVIEEVLGGRNYIVRLEDKELVWRRHINHIIKLEEFSTENEKDKRTDELEIKKASEEVDEKGKQNITDVNINNKLSLPDIKPLGQLETKSPKRLDL